MPGIAGIISRNGHPADAVSLATMVRCMAHEPFHSTGTYSCARLGIEIGWSSLEGSYSDCQPVWNETRDICLIFSGEHFGDRSETDLLKSEGHQFNESNASMLVHLYEKHGSAFVERLNGWFCGLLIDLRTSRALLFNDRFGMNRIYFHEDSSNFYFASEAKCLLKLLPFLRQLSPESMGEFISCGCVLQNRTLFREIQLLPGGTRWIFKPGQPVEKEYYFDKKSWESSPVLPAEEYYQKFKETWLRILPCYFKTSERVALSLTGGVDSRLILACAPPSPAGLTCYSFDGMYRSCADVTLSRTVASLCNQPHQTVLLGRPFLTEFPELAPKTAYLSDGTMDPTGTADLFVNRLARNIAPIRITGLNGGEILRRLVAFKPKSLPSGLLDPDFYQYGNRAVATYRSELEGNLLSFVAFKQSPWHLYPRLAIERSQLSIRSPYFDNEIVALAYQAPAECVGPGPALRMIAESAPALKKVGTDRALRLNPLPVVDWAHNHFQNFTFKAEYAYDYGMPQWLARLDGAVRFLHCERLFLGRHKFYHFRLWYRNEFSKFIKEVLLDPRSLSRPYLNGTSLEKLVSKHTEGRGNFTNELHSLLTLELMQRQLLEEN